MLRSPKVLLPAAAVVAASAIALYKYFWPKEIRAPQDENKKEEDVVSEEVKEKNDVKRILLVGSGMMTPCFIEYLTRRKENRITIASNILDDAKRLAEWRKEQCEAVFLDVQNQHEKLKDLVKSHDLAFSFIPAFLHIHVAKACLEMKKPFVTASYISPDLKNLNPQFQKANLLCMNEVGVDPGIDIMSTVKVVDEARERKAKIISYSSWCGGLPAPQCIDNPFGYKFSWTPRGALLSLLNEARFLQNGKEVVVPNSKLLRTAEDKPNLIKGAKLEGYPNRNSFPFREDFKMLDTKTFLRGTLRYKGFSALMHTFVTCGFLSTNPEEIDLKKYHKLPFSQFINELLLKDVEPEYPNQDARAAVENRSAKFPDEHQRDALLRMINKGASDSSEEELERFIDAVLFLELLSDETLIAESAKCVLDALCTVMSRKMMISDEDRDCLIMQHIFEIEESNGTKKRLTSTMYQEGEKKSEGGFSSMARTVGYPSAITTQLVLDGKLNGISGVRRPDFKEVYEPVLAELEKEGISLKDEWEISS